MRLMSQSSPSRSSGRPQKTDVEREFQRARLLAAATQLIREEGPDVSVDAIAAEAGYTKPILYELFGSKSGLAVALSFQLFGERLQSQLQKLRLDPASAVRGLIETYIEAVQRDPNVYRFVVIGSRSTTASFVEQPLFLFFGQIASSAIGISAPYSDIAAEATFSMIFATIESWSITKRVPADQLVSLLETMVQGALSAVRNQHAT